MNALECVKDRLGLIAVLDEGGLLAVKTLRARSTTTTAIAGTRHTRIARRGSQRRARRIEKGVLLRGKLEEGKDAKATILFARLLDKGDPGRSSHGFDALAHAADAPHAALAQYLQDFVNGQGIAMTLLAHDGHILDVTGVVRVDRARGAAGFGKGGRRGLHDDDDGLVGWVVFALSVALDVGAF